MKLLNGLLYEFKELANRSVFFLISFSLILLIFKLFLKDLSVDLVIIPKILVGAFLAAKTVLIVEQLGMGKNRRERRTLQPRYINVLSKTSLYTLIAVAFLLLEAFIKGFLASKSFAKAVETVIHEKFTHQFLAIIILLIVLFLVYNIFEEINLYMGEGKLKKFFFSKPKPNNEN